MTEKSEKALSVLERIKGGAMVLIGSIIIWFAIDNYIKLSSSEIGMAYVRMPAILEWIYDNLGLVPGVILQSIIGLALALYGLKKIISGK
ncbi:MAG: hypothetical protein ACRCY3_01920 [Sphingorhabdus sp.]